MTAPHPATIHDCSVPGSRRFSLRQATSSPIKVFTLPELGIDQDAFLSRMGPTFRDLPLDPYDPALSAERLVRSRCPMTYHAAEREWLQHWNDLGEPGLTTTCAGPQFWLDRVSDASVRAALEEIRPHRRRSCFQFDMWQPRPGHTWRLRENGCPVFAQAVSDSRARPRRFAMAPRRVYQDPGVHELLAFACQLVTQSMPLPQHTFRVTMHQMLTYANAKSESKPAPEGIHQDGSDFIVSALVIERSNIRGGVSKVYYNSGETLALVPRILQPGEGIFQADRYLGYWHEVTAIYPETPEGEAYRSIIGLDLNFVG